mmetsp:Transcript_21017/g.27339  ORF Transcript_21017/g.27339 Transcript_21017/m.27339 type:complete len:180 (-) Transcript_21017:103-642(-)
METFSALEERVNEEDDKQTHNEIDSSTRMMVDDEEQLTSLVITDKENVNVVLNETVQQEAIMNHQEEEGSYEKEVNDRTILNVSTPSIVEEITMVIERKLQQNQSVPIEINNHLQDEGVKNQETMRETMRPTPKSTMRETSLSSEASYKQFPHSAPGKLSRGRLLMFNGGAAQSASSIP